MLKRLLRIIVYVDLVLNVSLACAEDVLGYLTDKEGKYAGPTVEDNVVAMDADKNGFADVTEVRAFLVLKNGSDYQKEILDRWQLRSQGKSCTLPPDDKLFNQTNN
jgi:purine nucleoside permease